MRRFLAPLVFTMLVLAGCAQPGAPAAVLEVGEVAPFHDIVQERPVVAAAAFHESSKPGTLDALERDARPDRDATLGYHGIGKVHDEWGRMIDAHIFRYDPLLYVITNIEIDPLQGTLDFEQEYQERRWEFAFDAADGRALGLTDLDRGVRSFADPDHRLPYGPGYPGTLTLAMVAYMHGSIEAIVQYEWFGYNFTHWMEPYDGDRPLPGACDMYLQRSKTEGPNNSNNGLPTKPNADPYRSLVCFDTSMVPLWHWAGNQTGGSFSLQREGEGFSWPGPKGEILPPEPFDRAPMEAIEPWNPLADPIYIPPRAAGDDWAGMVQERVAALHYSVPYIQYDLQHEAPYAHHVITGWPPHAFIPLLGNVLGDVTNVARFKETSWVMVTDPTDWFWTNVHTLDNGGESVHFVPDQNGATFSGWPYPSRQALGDLVKPGIVVNRVPEFAPEAPRMVNWMVFPEFQEGFIEAWWTAASHCFEAADDPRFLMIDGIDGHLMAAGGMDSHPNGCSMGGFYKMHGMDLIEIFPPTPDRPTPIVLDGEGRLVRPLVPIGPP